MASQTPPIETVWVAVALEMQGMQQSINDGLQGSQSTVAAAGTQAGNVFSNNLAATLASSAAIGGAIIGLGKQLLDVAGGYDDVVDTIRVGTGATGDALEDLTKSSENLFSTLPTDREKAAGAVADLNTRLGATGAELEDIAARYLEAGRILGEDIDINDSTAAFRAFGLENENIATSMDKVFQVSQATGVGMNELFSGAQKLAPQMKLLGFSLEETVGVYGALEKAGMDAPGTLAKTGKAIATFAKDGEAPAEAFSRVTAEIQGLVEAGKETEAIDLASQVFGTRGASQFVSAIETQIFSIEDLDAALGTTSDTIVALGEETMDFPEKLQMFSNKAIEAITPIAMVIFDTLGQVLDALAPTIEVISGALAVFATWLGENSWALAGIATIMGGILLAAVVGVTMALWAMVAPVLANPLILVILGAAAAIGVVVAAIMWLSQNWETVTAFMAEIWTGIVYGLTTAWETFITGIQSFWDDFIGGIKQGGEDIGNTFEGIAKGIGNFFINLINIVINGINSISSLLNKIDIDLPWGGGWSPKIAMIPKIPQMAKGAVIKARPGGTLVNVGEAGRNEAIVDEGKLNRVLDNVSFSDRNDNGGNKSFEYNLYMQEGESVEEMYERLKNQERKWETVEASF